MTLRALTPPEQDELQRLRLATGNPVALDQLLRELVIARSVVRIVRGQRRCLPRYAQQALDQMPHIRATSVDFAHD